MKTLLAMLGLGISSLFGFEEEFYKDRINTISSYEVRIHTETELKDEEKLILDGVGFIFGKYLLTVDHVTSKYQQFLSIMNPYGQYMSVNINRNEVVKEETYLDDRVLFPVIEDQELDITIFDLSKDELLCNTYCNDLTIEDVLLEKDLYQGMKVYWIGSPENKNGFYKESIISKLRDENDENGPYEDSFMLQHKIIQGSSGKPIWSDGKVAGIAQYIWSGQGGFTFMDIYIDKINEYENER